MKYNPKRHGALCDACPRKKETPVPPVGPRFAKWCIVGQDPGVNEVRVGAPFVGNTGLRLFQLLARGCMELGKPPLPRSEFWLTNACLCIPVDKTDTREARKAVKCCRPRLTAELEKLGPNAHVLLLGKNSVLAVTGSDEGVGKLHGFHSLLDLEEMRSLEAKGEGRRTGRSPNSDSALEGTGEEAEE